MKPIARIFASAPPQSSPDTLLPPPPADRARLAQRYRDVRALTENLAARLSPEDQAVQSMPDASPTKWHRAHTTWFFETLVLAACAANYVPYDERYGYLFNSYYQSLGDRHPRPARGLLTRPSCDDIAGYRQAIDDRMMDFIARTDTDTWKQAAPLVVLGLHHEQQHQELLLTDILHAFSCNPLLPAYQPATPSPNSVDSPPQNWVAFPGGLHEIGHGGSDFAFDNETPRHAVALRPFALASRMITNGEWIAFIEDDGYARPELWLSDGWTAVREHQWTAPLYWRSEGGAWKHFSLHGERPIDMAAPVTHISFYEADAYARWAGYRLPTEAEWEIAAGTSPEIGNFLSTDVFAPRPASGAGLTQMFGDAWEWTQSAYAPYPGFRPREGAVSEYNGKFMINQMVLRGGSCLTPRDHIRPTYRNFFYPATRWQCVGLRLAKDL